MSRSRSVGEARPWLSGKCWFILLASSQPGPSSTPASWPATRRSASQGAAQGARPSTERESSSSQRDRGRNKTCCHLSPSHRVRSRLIVLRVDLLPPNTRSAAQRNRKQYSSSSSQLLRRVSPSINQPRARTFFLLLLPLLVPALLPQPPPPLQAAPRAWISASPRSPARQLLASPRAPNSEQRERRRAGMMGLGGKVSLLLLLLLGLLAMACAAADASEGDADPLYRSCVEECQRTGALKEDSIKHCMVPTDDQPADRSWYAHEPLYLQWKEWNCNSECRYHCMMEREKEREELALGPVKYHGKWPLKRASVFQEPFSAALSALTLLVQFNGWLSFFLLLMYKLPLRPETHATYYEYTGLWHIYGYLAMNSWFWSAIYHSCDTAWTEKLYFSSTAAFLGYSLILAILRTSSLRDEASRVMVAAPILAFVTTHILYLNFYDLNKDLNMKVCTVISIAQLLVWALWAAFTRHPSRLKIMFVALGGILSVFLEAQDVPPRWGYVDGHAICLAMAIPLSYLWWSFAKEDAEMRTSAIMKKKR